LEFGVEDTGIGISEADLPHVFERFRRAVPAAVRSTHGTGIGLALVKQMVELHGGQVAVRSRKGSGARFTFTIPLKAQPAVTDEQSRQGPASTPRSSRLPATCLPHEDAAANPAEAVEAANRQAEAEFDASKPVVLYVEDDADL